MSKINCLCFEKVILVCSLLKLLSYNDVYTHLKHAKFFKGPAEAMTTNYTSRNESHLKGSTL